MSQQPLDERPHQPTPGKISRLRLKGDIAISKDLANAFQFAAMLLAAILLWEAQLDGLTDLFTFYLAQMNELGPQINVNWDLIFAAFKPTLLLALICFVALIVANIVDVKGIVLNTQGLTPNFSRMNPINGIKEIFSLDSAINFIKPLIKFIVMTTALMLALFSHANDAIWTPACGITCQKELGLAVIAYLVGIFMLALVLFACVDMRLSRFLHKRKHRMSHKELKQDQKDNNVSPEMRAELARLRTEELEDSPENQIAINLVIVGINEAYGLFVYRSDPPIIIQTGIELAGQAKDVGVKTIYDDELSSQLSGYPLRKYLPSELARTIQKALVQG